MPDNKKEANKKQEGPRFDQLLYDVLENDKNDGAFLGEYHTLPGLRQALIYLAPNMKARKVTTISLEVRQSDIDSVIKAKSLEDYLKSPDLVIPKNYRPDEYYNLVKTYHKLGIKVLGHEDPDCEKLMMAKIMELSEKFTSDGIKKIEEEVKAIEDPEKKSQRRKELQNELIKKISTDKELIAKAVEIRKKYGATSDEGIKKRNEFAADYIKKNKLPGKVLVIGGAGHSQYHKIAPASKEKPDEKDGLDKRLGIPTINIQPIDGPGGEVGSTKVLVDGKAYEVVLPADLRKAVSSSWKDWPPKGGIPVVEHTDKQPIVPSIGPKAIPPAIPHK